MSTFVRPKWTALGRATLLGAFVALFGAPSAGSAQELADKYQQMRERQTPRARFSLHAEPSVVLQANQFQCGIRNNGDTCADIFNSPTGGGGFWPTGSPNQYMFNSGIMIAGIVPSDQGPVEWRGDTTGAYFMDARGTQQHGTPITNIYNSLDPDDIANWPDQGSVPGFPFASAYIEDPSIFNDVLLGRAFGSQQDTWVMYWEGDPALSANRDHPMGIAIEQRTMAWNFPAGNEATIYIFYKITNVTDNAIFQQLNEQRYGIALPDGGWRLDSVYLAYDADPDVTTDATENFASVILPFNMGITYHAEFVAPEFVYPPSLFYPPFFSSAPGIVGVQYLKSPVDPETGEEVGLTMFSVHENPGSCTGLCDPLGDKQLWRYISGNVRTGLGDPPCSFANPQESRICYLPQVAADARFFQASGPFSLEPGASTTIVVAMMAAATVRGPNSVVPGAVNPPGIPSLAPGCGNNPLPIEVAAGWISTPTTSCPASGEPVDLRDVNVVPNSLLGRAQVAQAVFDEKFLLPFAPEPPDFYLIPGDNRISIIWARSATEDTVAVTVDPVTGDTTITGGDPFANAATNPESPLYNPNYRQFDVEGYRIYRSTDNANFNLIAQYDYATSTFVDVRCESSRNFVEGDACADTVVLPINDFTDIDDDLLIDPFVLFGSAASERVRLASGDVRAFRGDTASAGDAEKLSDTGVPFGYVDTNVRNGFRYFYQVRAFDINSTYSGPISLESSSDTKSAIPQASAPNQVLASFTQQLLGGGDEVLDPTAPLPTIHPQHGTFDGPMPPTDALSATFVPLIERLLPEFELTWQLDSIVPHPVNSPVCSNFSFALGIAMCWQTHVTLTKDETVTQEVITGFTPLWGPHGFGDPEVNRFILGTAGIDPDPESLVEFGIPEGTAVLAAGVEGAFSESIWFTSFEGQVTRRYGSIYTAGGSRWFNGDNETVEDPARFIRVGDLAEVDTVFGFVHHTAVGPSGAVLPNSGLVQYFGYAVSWLMRAADIQFVWNGDGTVTVTDLTHQVPVDFKPHVQATYGFLTTDADGSGVVGWRDFFYIENLFPHFQAIGLAGAGAALGPGTPVQLTNTATLVPVSTSTFGSSPQTGLGFGLVINGERFIFEMTALPAAGTTWTLRTYAGLVTTPASSATTMNPSGYEFVQAGPDGEHVFRPPTVPHLRIKFETTDRTQLVGAPDLRRVHTVPDPYYAQSRFDLSPVEKALRFVNLPAQATIRIYTVSGLLVDVVSHNDPAGGGLATWDLKNRSGQFVASGVYFFHVSTPDGHEHIGRFTVINSGIGQ